MLILCCWHILAQLNQLINLKLNKIMKKLVHKIRLTACFFFFLWNCIEIVQKKARAQVCETVRTVRHTHLVFSCTLNGFCTEKTTKMLVRSPPFFLLLPLHTSTQSSKFRKKCTKYSWNRFSYWEKKIWISNFPIKLPFFGILAHSASISGRSQETMGFGEKV